MSISPIIDFTKIILTLLRVLSLDCQTKRPAFFFLEIIKKNRSTKTEGCMLHIFDQFIRCGDARQYKSQTLISLIFSPIFINSMDSSKKAISKVELQSY